MSNSLNLQEIDQEQSLNLCRFFIKAKQNVFLFGRRGVGKTQIAKQSAADCGYKINYVNLSVVERPDLAGYPNLAEQGDVVTYKSPYFLPTLKEGEKANSIILFDEVDKVSPEVTAPLLEILLSRTINGKPLNTVACILTGNLANEGAHSQEVSSALLDRGAKYILSFSFEKWVDWAKKNDIHDLILGFLIREPELACGETETTSFASPSPRGWTLASEALIQARLLKIVDINSVVNIISGYVGYEAGLKFQVWYEYYRRFEPFILSLIENGECSLDISELSPTELLIFCTTACYFSKQKIIESKQKNKLQCLDNLVKFFNQYHVADEVQLVSLSNAFSFEFITKQKLYQSPLFFQKISSLQDGVSFKKNKK